VHSKDLAITTSQLTKTFTQGGGLLNAMRNKEKRTITAVDDINLGIGERELFGLLGPNGAGKTSFIKILSTLLLPDKGTATVNGWDILEDSFKVRMSIGLTLSSERQLYWKLTARENLRYFASLYLLPRPEIEERVERLLELLDLTNQQDGLVENLSSGNKQKVALARALLNDPPILFLDEPTIGLDPTFSGQFREMIKKEINRSEKKTILLTTHYMEEADLLCDRIAFINEGRIVALDTPKNLKRSIDEKDILTLTLSHTTDDMMKKLSRFEEVSSIERLPRDNDIVLKIFTDSASACMQDIVSVITDERVQVRSFSSSTPTLEDVFIKLTGSVLE